MKKRLILFALLFAMLVFNGVAYPWSSTGGDGSNARALRETAVFFNNSGATLVEGQIVLLDKTGSGVSAGTTLGAYVTTTVDIDISGIVGVVLSTSALDQSPVVVVTKGPADTLILDSSDPIAISEYVGTSSTLGYGGEYENAGGWFEGIGTLGQALENGDGTDTGKVWVWVNPQ